MVLAWHSSPVDSGLLMQRQTIELLKLKKVQSKKIFGSVAAKNAELIGRDTHT